MLKRTLFVLLVALVTQFAIADGGLDDAKAQGLVGEDATGYLAAVVVPASKETNALISEINRQRRAEYERIAKANGIEVDAVEQLAAKKAIEKTQPGLYIRLPGSGWQKK